MVVLPVIDRELRASARHPFTYYLRSLGAGALLLAIVFFGFENGFESNFGGKLFGYLHFTMFYAIWILVWKQLSAYGRTCRNSAFDLPLICGNQPWRIFSWNFALAARPKIRSSREPRCSGRRTSRCSSNGFDH